MHYAARTSMSILIATALCADLCGNHFQTIVECSTCSTGVPVLYDQWGLRVPAVWVDFHVLVLMFSGSPGFRILTFFEHGR